MIYFFYPLLFIILKIDIYIILELEKYYITWNYKEMHMFAYLNIVLAWKN